MSDDMLDCEKESLSQVLIEAKVKNITELVEKYESHVRYLENYLYEIMTATSVRRAHNLATIAMSYDKGDA